MARLETIQGFQICDNNVGSANTNYSAQSLKVNTPVRIDNFLPPETWAQGWGSNPDPELLRATCPHFPGVKPPRAEAKNDCLKGEASQTKGSIAPNRGVIKVPNGGNKIPTICFMDLKTALVANQDVSPEESMGPGPDPMTATQEQENQVANLIFMTSERTPGPGAISLPLNSSTQTTWPHISQCPNEPPWKIVSVEVGCYIDQRAPLSCSEAGRRHTTGNQP
ncbi:hypothetical protein DSO57_1024979 [Entomophthora muscae]|uniref:Uncharacterized protein n=1 Tax=Entomophthora muscae TaxID=34485 RepID=A0ACC2SF06_9FUNG|nr:hypothetical protein DSO57_1024979 [Entomophthora muscae]